MTQKFSVRFPLCAALGMLSLVSTTALAGTKTTLYNFTGGADGDGPSVLIKGPGGVYYGITTLGGLVNCENGSTPEGCGVVFQLTPPAKKTGAWTETVLYSFTGGSDGGTPVGLVLGKDGKTLFGTTFGYQNNDEGGGVIFQLSPPATKGGAWTETVLHYFVYGLVTATNNDGGDPESSPIVGPDGTLYGTTLEGGPSIAGCPTDRGGCGTVWQLKPPYAAADYSLVYGFQGGSDGSDDPRSVAITKQGTLVGVNGRGGANGAGYFYQLTPPAKTAPPGTQWLETKVFSFDSTLPGYGNSPPHVAANGEVFDTGATGGIGGHGEVYYFLAGKNAAAGPVVFAPFNGSNGGDPVGLIPPPITVGGHSTLFGATDSDGATAGGADSGCGTVWGGYDLSGGGTTAYTLYVFQCGTDGAAPQGVVGGPKGTLLGVTTAGGASGAGTIFQIGDIGN